MAASTLADSCGDVKTKANSSPSRAAARIAVSDVDVQPGSTVTVSGGALQTDCADTPNGPRNTNGERLTDLEIVLAQDGNETVVAEVDAISGRYSKEIVIPESLKPGEARIWARGAGGITTDPNYPTLHISANPS